MPTLNVLKKLSMATAGAAFIALGAAGAAKAASFSIPGPPANNVDTNPATSIFLNVEQSGIISDLNLDILIDTFHAEDFDVFLVHNGISVQVNLDHTNPFTHLDNFDVTFDDEATQPFSALRSANGVGTFQPFQLLSAFDGQELAGILELKILDDFIPNEGNSLVSWSISGTTTSVPEPASVVGLLAIGTLGGGLTLKRKHQWKA